LTTIRKADLARELGVGKAAISQHVARGMPTLSSGLLDREAALQWVAEHIEPQQGRSAVRAAELLRAGKRKPDKPLPAGGKRLNGNGHAEPELLNPGQERARRDRALSERLERENLVAEGKLVWVDDTVTEVAAALSIVRNKLLSLPAKIAPGAHAAAAEGRQAVYQVIEREVLAILTELSGAGDAEDEAAA
jgi:hypothetical protein